MEFGKLERVEIREGWPRENTDFTPWLAKPENLSLLAEELDRELEIVETESWVGPFRADILAKCAGTGETVIIENQYGKTDHCHLGQLLTYAAGLGNTSAKTVVWIAETFQEEHRAAMDWLNQSTEPGIRFYGVELQLWRIGGSPVAPKFEVVSRPNDPQKKFTQQSAALTDTQRLYLDFWSGFVAYCENDTTLKLGSAAGQHWLATAIGRSGFGVNLTISKRDRKMTCQLWLAGGGAADKGYEQLLAYREDIVRALGPQMVFDPKPGKNAAAIYEEADAEISDQDSWPRFYEWMKKRGEAYTEFFKPLVAKVDLS